MGKPRITAVRAMVPGANRCYRNSYTNEVLKVTRVSGDTWWGKLFSPEGEKAVTGGEDEWLKIRELLVPCAASVIDDLFMTGV